MISFAARMLIVLGFILSVSVVAVYLLVRKRGMTWRIMIFIFIVGALALAVNYLRWLALASPIQSAIGSSNTREHKTTFATLALSTSLYGEILENRQDEERVSMPKAPEKVGQLPVKPPKQMHTPIEEFLKTDKAKRLSLDSKIEEAEIRPVHSAARF